MARPAHQPTPALRKQVQTMAGHGIKEDDIAFSLDISDVTLRKYYPRELRLGHIKANGAVAQNLYRMATGDGKGAVAAAIFWCKTRMGWRETNNLELTGKDGGPIEHSDSTARDEIERRITQLASRAGTAERSGSTH